MLMAKELNKQPFFLYFSYIYGIQSSIIVPHLGTQKANERFTSVLLTSRALTVEHKISLKTKIS